MAQTERPADRDDKESTSGGASDPDGSGRFLRCFGQQVKIFREQANLTQAELGSQLGYGEELISAVERGRRIPQPRMIERADEVLGAGGVLKAMTREVERARYPAFFRDAARLEAEAVELHVYDTHIFNGLLQTEGYARAMFSLRRPLVDEEVIEQRVASRLARQEIFDRRPSPILSFVIEEAVLRRPFGGREVLQAQLEQTLLMGQKRHVEVQVMPSGREDNAGIDGPFTLLTPKGGEQVAYVEAQGRGSTINDRTEVRSIAARYGIIRAQALTPSESSAFVEKLLGEV